ncbi:MAG: hypothetical protein QNJ94_01855 [Alphaproteobacteria bacterium]|nr:hypothetical protein [Alphaproteobacteria bacterium]
MTRALAFLARHATTVMALGVFLGLAAPALAELFRPLLVPTVFLLLVTSLLRQDPDALWHQFRRPWLAILVFAWLALGTSLIMGGVLAAVDLPPGLEAGLMLMACSAPLISCIPFALLFRLDVALTSAVTLGATLILPLYLPPLALHLYGIELDVGLVGFIFRLVGLIGGAFLVVWLLRAVTARSWIERQAVAIDGLNVILLLVFAVAIMDGVAAEIADRPGRVALYVASAFLANIGLQALGIAVFLWSGRERAVTCGMMSGNRNMAILIGALAGQVDLAVMLFFVLGQLPIYILPAVMRPVYRRLIANRAVAR